MEQNMTSNADIVLRVDFARQGKWNFEYYNVK